MKICKALEALGVFWEAFGSFDVNTVCPLPGSWINHVLLCFLHLFVILCLCAAVCGRQFLSRVDMLMQFSQCFLRAVYGNVVISRSKMDAHHKSLVFFRSLLPPAVANLMFFPVRAEAQGSLCVVGLRP